MVLNIPNIPYQKATRSLFEYFTKSHIVTHTILLLTLKPTSFYNIKKHGNRTLILKVNHACCAHITDCGLIAYQRIQAPFTYETKAYKVSFLLI